MMGGMADPRAGTLAQPSDLVDVAHLVTAYYTLEPDPDDVDQQVAFGTSGHRGSSLQDGVQRGAHRRDDAGDLRLPHASRGTTARSSSAATPTGCREPAWATAIEVLVANDVTVLVDSGDALHADAGRLARDHPRQRRAARRAAGLADGIVVTPSHNPPGDGGFKYNPPHGGPADTDATKVIAARANELIRANLEGVHRITFSRARAAVHVVRLHGHLRRRPAERGRPRRDQARPASGSAPTRWAARASTTGARSPSGTGST